MSRMGGEVPSSSSPPRSRRPPVASTRLQILVPVELAESLWELAYGEGLQLSPFLRRELELVVDRERNRRS